MKTEEFVATRCRSSSWWGGRCGSKPKKSRAQEMKPPTISATTAPM